MRNEKGAVLFLVVIYSFIMSMIGMAVLYMNAGEELHAKAELHRARAYYCAEAGLERAQAWVEAYGGFPTTDPDGINSPVDPMEPYQDQYVDENGNLDPDGKGIELGGEGLQKGYYKFQVIPERDASNQPVNPGNKNKSYTLVATGECAGYTKTLERRNVQVRSTVEFAFASMRDVDSEDEAVYWTDEDLNKSVDDKFLVSLDKSYSAPVRTNFALQEDSDYAKNYEIRLSTRIYTSLQEKSVRILFPNAAPAPENPDASFTEEIVRERFIEGYANFVRNTNISEGEKRYFKASDYPNLIVALDGTDVHILKNLNDRTQKEETLHLNDSAQTEIFCEGNITIATGPVTAGPYKFPLPFAANLTLVSSQTIFIQTDINVQRTAADPNVIQYAVGLVGSSVCIHKDVDPTHPNTDLRVHDIRLDCSIAAVNGSFYARNFNVDMRPDTFSSHPEIDLSGCVFTCWKGAVGQLDDTTNHLVTGYQKKYRFHRVLLDKLPPHFVGYNVFRGQWSDNKPMERS